MRSLLVSIVLTLFINQALTARILSVLPMPGKSHHGLFQSILKTLAARGHHIVNYSPITLEESIENYTEVFLDGIKPPDMNASKETIEMFMKIPRVGMTTFLWKEMNLTKEAFENIKIKELIASNEKFDLILLEAQFSHEALLGFGHKFKAPVVSLQPFGAFSIVSRASGNPLSLAYIADFPFSSTDNMSFCKRFLNTISILGSLAYYYTIYLPQVDDQLREAFKDPTMPAVVDMIHNISLFINNAHPNIHYSQPYTSNMVPVGGIHLLNEHIPLPPEMKKFVDEAKHGVIYFSLGSIVPDYVLGQEFFDMFLDSFSELPQRVLWKSGWNHTSLPDNVMTAKWMPQQNILAHPNVILFITHGGLFSQHEAINAGVPVVCIPFFGDQMMNARFYEKNEIGIELPFLSLSEDTITSTLTNILKTPKYKENMQRMSLVYQDRPTSPADNLVFWVEYVLRHGGAPNLRPASALMPWYQLWLLDVIAVTLLTTIAILTAAYLVMRKILRSLMRKANHSALLNSKKIN